VPESKDRIKNNPFYSLSFGEGWGEVKKLHFSENNPPVKPRLLGF
jgi:hypothetical protein